MGDIQSPASAPNTNPNVPIILMEKKFKESNIASIHLENKGTQKREALSGFPVMSMKN
ncbi:MAG: hypothetical protein IPP38_00355 [Bacteroidetes bacterium]|nr:hypothetical protein [Bacteroidota bacterium]